MPSLITNQSGSRTPVQPTKAGGENVATAAPRVLSMNALAQALETFESQGDSENQSRGQRVLHAAEQADTGVVAGGQSETAEEIAAREGAEAAAQAEALANETPEETAAREEAEAAARAEAIANETPEETAAREAAEAAAQAEAEGAETPEEIAAREGAAREDAEFKKLPIGVQKRIGKLLEKQRALEAQVASAQQEIEAARAKVESRPVNGQTSGPLETVTDVNELTMIAQRTEAALDELGSLQKKLTFAPGKVEAFLRSQKVELKDGEGNDDYTPERMADVLDDFERGLKQTLRAVPARAQWLQGHAKASVAAKQRFPWIGKQGDQRAALLSAMSNANPAVKAAPDFEYWLACAVEKHMELEQQAKGTSVPAKLVPATQTAAAKPVVKPAAAVRVTTPNTGTVGSAAPKGNPDKAKIETAKRKVLAGGGRAALAEFMGAAGRY